MNQQEKAKMHRFINDNEFTTMYVGGGAEYETTVVDSQRLRRLISKMNEQSESQITEEQAWNKIAESYPESPVSLRNLFDNILYSMYSGYEVTINDLSFLTAKEPHLNSGQNLFESAEEMAQEKYRQTIDFDAKNIGVAFANVFRKEKLSEPQYKDTISKENYLEEMISYMEMLYEMDCKDWSKTMGKTKSKIKKKKRRLQQKAKANGTAKKKK